MGIDDSQLFPHVKCHVPNQSTEPTCYGVKLATLTQCMLTAQESDDIPTHGARIFECARKWRLKVVNAKAGDCGIKLFKRPHANIGRLQLTVELKSLKIGVTR